MENYVKEKLGDKLTKKLSEIIKILKPRRQETFDEGMKAALSDDLKQKVNGLQRTPN